MTDKSLYNKNIFLKNGRIIYVLVFLSSLAFLICPASSKEIKDIEITLAIDSQLRRDENMPADMIDIVTKKGIVTMKGFVKNLQARQRAARIALTVKGVRAVINRIELQATSLTDEQIRLDVEQTLRNDTAVNIYNLTVTVRNGVVDLKGRIDSWHEKELYVQIVKGVKGVKKVIPNFKVLMKSKRLDGEIMSEIKRRLAWDVWVDDTMIDVKVKKGDVFLSGTVGSLAEKTRAYRDAWIAGVRSVKDDNLFIDWSKHNRMRRHQEHSFKSDEEIGNAINEAFSFDPRVTLSNLNVSVNVGEITLTGHVDSLKAKRAAEQDAKNTVGVWHVNNNLKIHPGIRSSKNLMPDIGNETTKNPALQKIRDNSVM
jgi:osmotically-inducible protein OsmY